MNDLKTAIEQGITRCVMCQMKNSPAAEDVPVVVETYFEAFSFKGLCDLDHKRVVHAFRDLIATSSYFPTPSQVIEALPKKVHEIIEPSRRIERKTGEGDIAREHMAKWRAINAGEWKYNEPWTDELQEKYKLDHDPSPAEIARKLKEFVL